MTILGCSSDATHGHGLHRLCRLASMNSFRRLGEIVEYKDIRPTQVLLDPDNPRLPDGTSNDREAINRLIAEGFDQLVALARDMVDRGEANPSELPIVMKDRDRFVVLEGNRRFAVLKLLDDPRLAHDPAHQAAFDRVRSRDGKCPSSIHCAVVASREEADHWITLRHTGANNGVGVRVWSSEQSARHRQRMKKPIEAGTARSITIADELTEAYQLDDSLTALIAKVRAEKLTNIGRLFATDVMIRLQFRIERDSNRDADVLLARHTANELHPLMVWAFEYLDRKTVDDYKNPEVRETLLNSRADVLPDAGSALPDHRRLADLPYSPSAGGSDDGSGRQAGEHEGDDEPADGQGDSDDDTSGSSGDTGGSGTGGKRGTQPETRLYSKVKLPSLTANVRSLLKEAQQLRFDSNPAITCVLARVVLELAVSDPKVLKWAGTRESDSLDHKIKHCILMLDPEIEKPRKRARPDLVQSWHEASGIGVAYLHQFLHNPQVKSDRILASRFSEAFTPLLNLVDDAVK